MNIPYHRQITDYYCGPASLQMVFEYFGLHKSQRYLAKQLQTQRDDGTDHSDLIRVATSHGLYCYVNRDSSIHEILHFLSLELPVIIDFMEPSGNEAHYAIVSGYKNQSIILHDPWNGKQFSLQEAWFEKHWYDRENNAHQWIMVVSPHDIGFGKQYHPKQS